MRITECVKEDRTNQERTFLADLRGLPDIDNK